ncbi:MAG: hypothetical protein P1U90_14025 [Akkermansiaceae bacterium]|jgi:hypothetical protein|nr:hypothetical protein [Akkermansiaceae bacterium]
MPKTKSTKPWPLADAMFVEVEITHPRERQMHLIFQNGVRLVLGDDSQLPLAAALIVQLRKLERTHQGGQS